LSTLDSGAVDLDLDLDLESSADESNTTARTPLDATQPLAPRAAADGDMTIAFTPTSVPVPAPALSPPPAAAPASAPAAQEFDLSGISLDFDLPESPKAVAPAVAAATDLPSTDFGAIELPALDAGGDAASDPISRKLELAEEFRQIGDTEGARDLLQEVVAKAEGALKAKAQGMLDALS
jgi:pilus assembly protein FimV